MDTLAFSPSDLDANRAGMISERQREVLNRYVSQRRSAIALLIGTSVLVGVMLGINAVTHEPGALVWAVALPFFIVIGTYMYGMEVSRITGDLTAGRVEKLSGAVRAVRVAGGRSGPRFYVEMDKKRYRIVAGGKVRRSHDLEGAYIMYYAPRSKFFLSLERIE